MRTSCLSGSQPITVSEAQIQIDFPDNPHVDHGSQKCPIHASACASALARPLPSSTKKEEEYLRVLRGTLILPAGTFLTLKIDRARPQGPFVALPGGCRRRNAASYDRGDARMTWTCLGPELQHNIGHSRARRRDSSLSRVASVADRNIGCVQWGLQAAMSKLSDLLFTLHCGSKLPVRSPACKSCKQRSCGIVRTEEAPHFRNSYCQTSSSSQRRRVAVPIAEDFVPQGRPPDEKRERRLQEGMTGIHPCT